MMAIPFSKGSAVNVSDTRLDIELLSRTPELTYGVAKQERFRNGRALAIPYTYHFRIEKARLYYQFVMPPRYIRETVIRHLKYMNIRAYDIGLRKKRQVEKRMGLDIE